MDAKFLNAATNAAIELAKLAATIVPESPSALVVADAWKRVQESFVRQLPPAQRMGFRTDLDELFINTKRHAGTRTQRITDAMARRKTS